MDTGVVWSVVMLCELEATPEAIFCVEATFIPVAELVLFDGHADATESQP